MNFEILTLEPYNFEVIIGDYAYNGEFSINITDNNELEVEITDITKDKDPDNINMLNLLNPTLLVRIEEEIEELGTPYYSQWISDFNEDDSYKRIV